MTLLSAPPVPVADGFVDAFGGRYYRIADCGRLPPFFMNIVSPTDLWLFLASNGGLTAGRVNAAGALFPYQPVDRIYDSAGVTGPFTLIRAAESNGGEIWQPLAAGVASAAAPRHLYKSIEGDRIWFEENNHELGLVFRHGWSMSEAHGLTRHCSLENTGNEPVTVDLIDGLKNFLPPNINPRLQSDSSCLVDAYKTAELLPGTTMAVYSLSAGITDQPTPLESLRATIVWSAGLTGARVLLSTRQFTPEWPQPLQTEWSARGIRSMYALSTRLTLAPHANQQWAMVADTGLDHREVTERRARLHRGIDLEHLEDAARDSTRRLRALVGSADGIQAGGAETTAVHHFANTLFNLMRGGVFASGYSVSTADFATFLHGRNRPVATRHAPALASLAAELPVTELVTRAAATGDRDLARLALEYLPLTFSRRHGDPSRPWNCFNIQVRDAAGARVLNYEGNWRDIFQNWEALCLGFPEFIESIIAKFLNASTLDGYNPYRLSRAGVEWEVPEPEHPWASIGYWGDHQTVYLLKLLESSRRFHPDRLARWLRERLFSFADVPYRLSSYDQMRRDPRTTITFDHAAHRAVEERERHLGTDARLVCDSEGNVRHASLGEKLILLVLTRLTNFIPQAGIWMNTQRPEWNDANNALVGRGASFVTVCYLRRMLAHLRSELLTALGQEPLIVAAPLALLARRVTAAFERHRALLTDPALTPGDASRRLVVDALATAGAEYRDAVYGAETCRDEPLARGEIDHLLQLALASCDQTIRGGRRPDGLYHSYSLLEFADHPSPALRVEPLGLMLEGQVAVLSAGVLSPEQAVALLHSLRRSPLYRPDQHSYLLYPDRVYPGFLERNQIPPALADRCSLLRDLLNAGDTRLVLRDADGVLRFHSDLVSEAALLARLAALRAEPGWAAGVAQGSAEVTAIYNATFHHPAYTGRSGSMFGYEGLGCIYWHMVAKLLLAVQENLHAAEAAKSPALRELVALYHDIRGGLGFNKTARAYGAFPTDPYSHTPGHSGAQQPGMTGQVKEEIITRFGELGVHVQNGELTLRPFYLQPEEFTTAPAEFRHVDPAGREQTIALPARSLAFTYCGVPIVYRLHQDSPRMRVRFSDGTVQESDACSLSAELSGEVFRRSGRVARLELDWDERVLC